MKNVEKMREIKQEIKLHLKYIDELKGEILRLNPFCEHTDVKGEFYETFAFDMTPRIRCIDCRTFVRPATKDEIKALYLQALREIRDEEVTEEMVEEFYQENPTGFNY